MLKMMEFKVDLDGTAEEREQMQQTKGMSGITSVISLPKVHDIKRVGIRIVRQLKSGIHPETKQLGKFIEQEECLYVWAECDDQTPMESHKLWIIPTGAEVPHAGFGPHPYLGTFLMQGGAMAFHVYGPVSMVA